MRKEAQVGLACRQASSLPRQSSVGAAHGDGRPTGAATEIRWQFARSPESLTVVEGEIADAPGLASQELLNMRRHLGGLAPAR